MAYMTNGMSEAGRRIHQAGLAFQSKVGGTHRRLRQQAEAIEREQRAARLEEEARARREELQPRWKKIVNEVAKKHDIPFRVIMSDRRSYNIVRARQECYWQLYTETTMSMPLIGRVTNRHHTSILHGIRRHCEKHGLGCPMGLSEWRK